MLYFCSVCHQPIDEERVAALKILDTLIYEYTCRNHAPDSKKHGLFTGASGISPLIICDKIGNESHLSEQDEEIQKQFKIGQNDIIEEYYSDNN